MSKESTNNDNFENQLAELEKLVTKMENGDVSLDDSLKNFEKGIKLARNCQKSLKDAELKVKVLLSEDDKELSDFEE